MPPDGTEPIADDEILYRRIPVSQNWYDPNVSPKPSSQSFHPTKYDTTGLSLSRGKYTTIEEAAQGTAGKSYYVAVLQAGDLRAQGITLLPKPEVDDPGHCEIPSLTYQDRNTDQSLESKTLLAEQLCLRVEGPFSS